MTRLTSPKPASRSGILSDRNHIGNCVLCRRGIYTGDTHTRGRGQHLGLICDDHPNQTGATR